MHLKLTIVSSSEDAAIRSTRESFQLGDRTEAGQGLFDALRRKIDRIDTSYAY